MANRLFYVRELNTGTLWGPFATRRGAEEWVAFADLNDDYQIYENSS